MHDFVTDIFCIESRMMQPIDIPGAAEIFTRVLLGSGSACTSGNSEGLGQVWGYFDRCNNVFNDFLRLLTNTEGYSKESSS